MQSSQKDDIAFAILHNVGEDSEYSRPNSIRIITIGVGIQGYNDQLLEQIARHGNGWYRYLDTVEQGLQTFGLDNHKAPEGARPAGAQSASDKKEHRKGNSRLQTDESPLNGLG